MTGQGDVPGVAAEEDDVLLDPVERRYLVHQAVVCNPGTQVGRHVSVKEPWLQQSCLKFKICLFN